MSNTQGYYKTNRDTILARIKAYQSSDSYKEKKREYDRVRRSKLSEHIRQKFTEWYSKNKEHMVANSKQWKKSNPLKAQFNRYKERAKKKGIDFAIDKDEFELLIQEDCVYCGKSTPLGLDRIDSSEGYTKNNVAPCCKFCNTMKLNYSIEDFLIQVSKINKHLEL